MRRLVRKLPLLLLFLYSNVWAQQPGADSIRNNFDNVRLSGFFNRLEKQEGYTFYYDRALADSFTIQLDTKGMSLSRALQEAFKGTDFVFSIDTTFGNVYITRKLKIITELPAQYTGIRSAGKNTDAAVIPDFGMDGRQMAKTSTEATIEIGNKKQPGKGMVTITGFVRNAKTGEPITNATVSIDSEQSAVTDPDGRYVLNVPSGNHAFNVSVAGMKDASLQIAVYSTGNLNVDMEEQVRTLREVVISSSRTTNVRSVQMGVQRLTIENIRRIPTVFGEADVLKAIVSLPGVKTVGEASTGFNVRGGSTDQNLILFNDATIYNPSHFFGLFSAFNPDVIRNIELYKSSIPAKYGGRLASVLDIAANEGNKKNIKGAAGIGPVTSRFYIEGPLDQNKTSFILGGRATYANWLLKLLPSEYENSKASFQDVNLLLNHRIDSNNNLYLTGYFSNDRFSLGSDTTYGYSNRNINIKWRHYFTRKLSAAFTAGYDQYLYNVSSRKNEVNAFRLGFDINQLHFKSDFEYFLNGKHSFDFGINTIRYTLHPGFLEPGGAGSEVTPDKVSPEQAQESGIYFSHRFNPGPKWSLSTGLRYSMFNYLGPQEVRSYVPGQPVIPANLVETTMYGKGKFIHTYQGPELRFSARYAFSNTFSLKAAYNSLRQYIHLLSNTTIIAPTDIWKLSDPNIRPQKGQQVSFGIYKNLRSNTIETSLEVYYKKIQDYLDYRPGATLFLNHSIETEVVNTRGKAYGVELLVKKTAGRLTGWISYTWSRILLQANDTLSGVMVNQGSYYPANYDKPHDVTMTGNFKVNHRFSLSLNVTYSTGRPITLPVGRYYYAGSQRVLYSDRNAYRIPDYYRADFSMNIDGNHKVNQKTHNSWTIGVYNLLGRKNPYSVYYVSERGRVHGYKLSIFGSAIPFVNFNIFF